MNRQIYPSYAKIRLMRSEIKGFGTIVHEILSGICEDPTYVSPTFARFTVFTVSRDGILSLRVKFTRSLSGVIQFPYLGF